ncbi:hypothetical protein [Sulfuricurvum sp.]|uniref:hypothetical protein n=1 Tax=Sulfuricurvum sp. TaxID=2025608 RepID=UPI00262126F6|nr:hypothetical protein [Sulfuricurvum sp.]MDD3596994.1 hypothetical protein [Sulfuricurvum sp.]
MASPQQQWEMTSIPKIDNEKIEAACKSAQLLSIQEKAERFKEYDNDWIRNYILGYYDTCTFYAHQVNQSEFKNLTSYLNRQAAKGAIIKCHTGAGSYARYVFPKSILSSMIDEILQKLNRA